MQLIIQFFLNDSIYATDYTFEGLSIGGADAASFWRVQLARLAKTAGLTSLVWDGQADVWFSSDSRVNSTSEQEVADSGFADEAFRLRLPLRVDGALPSDILASTGYDAFTAVRVTGDANPHYWFELNNWVQLGANSLLAAALGARPMADVLWTIPLQPGDPRWMGHSRPNIRHDLTIAVLSTGPVGFGDLVGDTDAALLRRAMRRDGVLLKPGFPSVRTDRYFTATGGAEIWTAPTGPAMSDDPRVDARANSMAVLEKADGEANDTWWWVVLATNVDGNTAAGRPFSTSELWPTPPQHVRFVVSMNDYHVAGQGNGAGPPETAGSPCIHGEKALSCLHLWDPAKPLNVSTASGEGVQRSFALLSAAPVLPSGWALLGELDKIVPVSPQRFIMRDAHGVLHHQNLGSDLRFTVLGAPGEAMSITLIAPAPAHSSPLEGIVIIFEMVLGAAAGAHVVCNAQPAIGVAAGPGSGGGSCHVTDY